MPEFQEHMHQPNRFTSMKPEAVNVPRWPLQLLRGLLRSNYLEEIEGDMEEIFYDNLTRMSPAKARRQYILEMLKLLRPSLIKNMKIVQQLNQYGMLSNYFKVSVRGLMKNPLSSFINVFGLAVAIGISLVVYAFLKFDRSIDQFHEFKNEVYLTTFFANHDGTTQQYGTTPRPLGELMQGEFPGIKKMCRVDDAAAVVKNGDNVFPETVRYVDPVFLDMFTFPLKWGSKKSLHDINAIILSEEASIKYFGDENPVGQQLQVIFSDSVSKMFAVGGVAKAFPKPHAIEFSFLMHFENTRVANIQYNPNDWSQFLSATLIQVPDAAHLEGIKNGMAKYKILQNKAEPDWAIDSFAFEPLATLHANSGFIRDDISFDDNREGRIGMPIIALFMLALACLNYINIAIVSATKRLKEIGVRKVIGANRGKVIFQFLAENVVVTYFALVIGCLLGAFIFLPWFVQFSGWQLELHLTDTGLWMFLLALLLITGLVSGIYPAFYVSKFEAVKIFKGSMTFGRKNPLTKIFLAVQLVLACITITAAVVFTQNNSYQNNLSWGYHQHKVLFAQVPSQAAFEQMSVGLTQNPNVEVIAGAQHHVGKTFVNALVRRPPSQVFEVNQFAVAPAYFETMGLQVVEGRAFNAHPGSDRQAVLVNETLVQNLGLQKPLGAQLEMDSIPYEVIGVVKDFHARNLFSKIEPAIFKVANEADYRFLTLRVRENAETETYAAVQAEWTKLYPEVPFQGGFQEDTWGSYFMQVNRSETFNKVLSFIAVMLAGLGLYGLVTLNVSGRVREFSIRKALGAGTQSIAASIMSQYILLLAVAIVIGVPISYIFTQAYLDMLFAYPMPISWTGIAIAIFLLAFVIFMVISTQVRKVAKSSPVEGLKAE